MDKEYIKNIISDIAAKRVKENTVPSPHGGCEACCVRRLAEYSQGYVQRRYVGMAQDAQFGWVQCERRSI